MAVWGRNTARITDSLDEAMMISEDAHQDFVLIDGRMNETIIEPGYPRPLPSLGPTYQNKRQKLPVEKSVLP